MWKLPDERIKIVVGDIVRQEVDAVVNAANESLLGGGGVDGAIHRAAGPELLAECRTLNGCATGDAKTTCAYGLPAKWIIHTVGPVWRGDHNGAESERLASAYRRSLEEALCIGARSVAFPAISTGAYQFPLDRAAVIAIREISSFLQQHPSDIDEVRLVCFTKEAARTLEDALADRGTEPPRMR